MKRTTTMCLLVGVCLMSGCATNFKGAANWTFDSPLGLHAHVTSPDLDAGVNFDVKEGLAEIGEVAKDVVKWFGTSLGIPPIVGG